MFRILTIAAMFLLPSGLTQGQLATSLRLSKKTFVAGEPVIAEITVTNHSGRELTLASTRQLPWLSFVVNKPDGNLVSTRKLNAFGAMKIGVGGSLAKKVDLSEFFLLNSQGNYSVTALVRDPGGGIEGSATNRVLFSLNPGRTYWSQKIGLGDESDNGTREMKLLTFNNGSKSQLYAQVIDSKTGGSVRTFLLGDALMLRKPLVTLDGSQRMHVMFLATPSIWVHCQVNSDGQLVARDLHQRANQGDPVLMAYGDGSVQVHNSVIFDPAAAQDQNLKIRKASDRPIVPFE